MNIKQEKTLFKKENANLYALNFAYFQYNCTERMLIFFFIDFVPIQDCDLLLSSEAEGRGCFPLDDHILCRNCNAKRVQEITAP